MHENAEVRTCYRDAQETSARRATTLMHSNLIQPVNCRELQTARILGIE